jgi:transcriptional regulator with XRE-family HTH domain
MNERLKELRKALSMTQEEFSVKIGISRGSLANYEVGRNIPIDGIIRSICREFNVYEEWLRTGNGEMFEEHDDANIRAVVKEYKLGAIGETILKAYSKMPPQKREAANDFMYHFARAVLDGKIEQTKYGVFNEVLNFARVPEHLHDSVAKGIHEVFNTHLPPAEATAPPAPAPSRLEAFKRGAEMAGTESGDEIGAYPETPATTAFDNEREKALSILEAQAKVDAQHNHGGESAKSSS